MSATQVALFDDICPKKGFKSLEELVFLSISDTPRNGFVIEPDIVIAFNQDAFEKPRKPSEETMRSLYIGNLTRVLFTFYGGNLSLIAAYETQNDWREEKKMGLRGDFERDRNGMPVTEQCRVREHYPDNPPLSAAACRELAARIINDGKYEEALMLSQKASHNESYRLKVDALCENYGWRPDTQGKVHEELFTFYLMRLPLFAPIKLEEENKEERRFVSRIGTTDPPLRAPNNEEIKQRMYLYTQEPVVAWRKS